MYPDYVIKSGARVSDQRRWLREHAGADVVSIISSGARDEMIMERLYPLDFGSYLDSERMAHITTAALQSVWKHQGVVSLSVDAHVHKVTRLCRTYGVDIAPLSDTFLRIDWKALHACQTHGDPTFENVMARRDGSVVLIDPIPATSAVPNLRCVDLGKVLQSIGGWEQLRYSHEPQAPRPRAIDAYLDTVTDDKNEQCAARYWHVVHLMRALPYVKGATGALLGEMIRAYVSLL